MDSENRLVEEAEKECERCQGRAHGDCDSACQYWEITASESERELEERKPATEKVRTRAWLGAVSWKVGEPKKGMLGQIQYHGEYRGTDN